jgi:hypothetical protein
MTEMVDRVALAISGAPFPSERARSRARAAIEAMRGPTDAMIYSGGEFIEDNCANPREPQMRAAWDAMIDEALKES